MCIIDSARGGGGYSKNIKSINIHGPSLFSHERDDKAGSVVWRTKLVDTEPFWKGWFEGMNKAFLNARVPKILAIASPDRLDKEMTIAHMQGKFQLEVSYHTSHHVHEDDPRGIAAILLNFNNRYRFGQPLKIPYIKH